MKVLTLDIGGSSIKYALMNEQCEILKRGEAPVPLTALQDLYAAIETIWKQYPQAEGLAISMPGVIDSTQGIAYTGGALQYLINCPLASDVSKRLGCPVWIGNDAKCAGIAEVGHGVLQDVDDAIVLILGTGIGGCLIKDRKVHQGKHFAAGEVSSIRVNDEKIHDEFKQWWAINGIYGLSAMAQKHLHSERKYTGKELFALANEGNSEAIAAISEFSEKLALQIYNLQAVFDAEKVAIGGGISAQPLLLELIQEHIDLLWEEFTIPLYKPEIAACAFRNDANLIGACYQFLETML